MAHGDESTEFDFTDPILTKPGESLIETTRQARARAKARAKCVDCQESKPKMYQLPTGPVCLDCMHKRYNKATTNLKGVNVK